MYSRRHPYLFFILCFTAIVATLVTVTTLVSSAGSWFSGTSRGEKIGVVELSGVIVDSKKTIENIVTFRKDKKIKAIVLRINSPGGGVGPSQEIYREILKTKKVKPIITSVGSVAASGGYYAACATDGIMVNAGSITGSIGVVMGYTNFGDVMRKIGLVPVVIKAGNLKDIGSPVREMSPEERRFLQRFVDDIHTQFIEDVASGRSMDPSKVRELADGRIFTGREALSLGMVDRIGNLEDAVVWAGELSGIEGEPEVIYPKKDEIPFMSYLENRMGDMLRNITAESGLTVDFKYQP